MNIVNEKNAAEVARAIRDGVLLSASTVRRSPGIGALAIALAKAQQEMGNPKKEKQNPHLKNWYADLSAVREAVLPALLKNGLVLTQLPCELDDGPALTTILIHGSSGEWLETTIKLRVTKPGSQEVGSALTYARRYALQAIGGVAADDDDDGHAASQPARQQPRAEHAPSQAGPEKPANLALRAKRAMQLAQCPTRVAYLEVCKAVAQDVKDGLLTEEDRLALAPVARETNDRFPAPAKA